MEIFPYMTLIAWTFFPSIDQIRLKIRKNQLSLSTFLLYIHINGKCKCPKSKKQEKIYTGSEIKTYGPGSPGSALMRLRFFPSLNGSKIDESPLSPYLWDDAFDERV